MGNTIELKLAWQKAYEEWHKTAPQDTDMDSLFKAGFYAGQQAKQDEIEKRVSAFIRGHRVDR